MVKKTKSIPVNKMADAAGTGIAIEELTLAALLDIKEESVNDFEETTQSHRHDRHSFFLLRTGTIHIEIDFQKHEIIAPSVIYIHPDQVHRTIAFENVTVSSLAINNENLNPEYLKLLEDITPVKPLALQQETFSIIAEAIALCLKFADRKEDKLYHSQLKDSSNALVALILSQYLEQVKSTDKLSRFEVVTKAFKETLEQDYASAKSPAEYAQKLHLSTPYLNECVKYTTGFPVSYHIQQRIVLEAKRLLYYSNKSVKEIATDLGYDDYPYFSRLFTKVAGMTAIAFRNKNLD